MQDESIFNKKHLCTGEVVRCQRLRSHIKNQKHIFLYFQPTKKHPRDVGIFYNSLFFVVSILL